MATKTAKKPAKAKTAAKAKAPAKPKVAAQAATKPKTAAKPAAKPKTAAKAAAKPKAAPKAGGAKSFDTPKAHDFTIRDNTGVVGHVRVKPNAIAWKPKAGKAYQQITLDQLAAFAAENGRQVQA